MALKFTFSEWKQTGRDSSALRLLLADQKVWDQQRTDHCNQPMAINADYKGSFLALFWREDDPMGFALFIPQQRGLYELHIGFKSATPFEVVSAVRKSVAALFGAAPFASIVAAACPDWNAPICRLASILVRTFRRGRKPRCPTYHVASFARRDGRAFGATVFSISRGEIAQPERTEESWA